MKRAWAVCKRDFAGTFTTPVGYVVVGVYALITGLAFTASFVTYTWATQSPASRGYTGVPDLEETMLSPFLVFCGQVLMFMVPLITMRSLAEERNRGTMELLLTHPLRDRDIIFGKYLAALGVNGVLMLVVAVYLALVASYTGVEPAVLVFGLVTVFLMGAAFTSLGLFISSVTKNQITAASATFGVLFISYVLGVLADNLSEDNPAPDAWDEQIRAAVGAVYTFFGAFARELPLDAHASNMAQGVVEPVDVAYYVLFAAFFLFLTFRSLESRKWRLSA
jgi:ABC-2 type transport system permease protein